MRLSLPFPFALVVLSAFLLAASVADAEPAKNKPNFDIVTLSNRADLISGGDALAEISVPRDVPLQQVRVLLNDDDVTGMFQTDAAARTMRGVVTGLVVGTNELVADSNGRGKGRPRASLTITNHPTGGPVLLGAQTQPWVCATPAPVVASGTRRRRTRAGCRPPRSTRSATSRPSSSSSTAPRTRRCSSASARPDPAGRAAGERLLQAVHGGHPARRSGDDHDDDGRTVPYIVRVERGTINRGIYDIAVLFDPTKPLDGARAAGAVERQGGLQFGARPASRGCSSAPSRTGPMTRRCRAASWSSTTA